MKNIPMNWISVKDQLPIHGQKVLLVIKDYKDIYTGKYEENWKTTSTIPEYVNCFWVTSDCCAGSSPGSQVYLKDILYWMPQPEMPNEEK